jgi:branched-chain amino acid transport system permease protein
MNLLQELKQSTLAAVWFMFLTFPLMVIRVNTVTQTIEWRWGNMAFIGIAFFFLSALWRYMLKRKEKNTGKLDPSKKISVVRRLLAEKRIFVPVLVVLAIFTLVFPHAFSMYQTNIMISALIYVMLGLGLNIVIGLAGLLDLGYVAFFAVGAYAYALLNLHFGMTFWMVLPLGGLLGAIMGVILGYPVLRLRGDYLAIVTLGFGEIIRLVLENWNEFSKGPSGIANIPKPGLFGFDLTLQQHAIYL